MKPRIALHRGVWRVVPIDTHWRRLPHQDKKNRGAAYRFVVERNDREGRSAYTS